MALEKTIFIDGKQVRLKSTAAMPLRYKAQFGSDFFADVLRLSQLNKFQLDDGTLNYEVLERLDFEVFYRMIWSMAKTADPEIPDPMTWLDGFETFPIMEIVPEIQDLILANLQTAKKK